MLLNILKGSGSITKRIEQKEVLKLGIMFKSCASSQTAANEQPQPNVMKLATKAKIKAPKSTLRREKQQALAQKKTVPYIPGLVNVQVLGSGANGAPAAVYLFTDQSRYLFNCGEGTQRLAHEHKTKLSRLEHVFVTRNTWSTIGGFPGLALTVQDAGVKQLSLHGPPHLESVLNSMKRFVMLKALQVKTIDCTQLHDFEDTTMLVKSVPLYQNNLDKNLDKIDKVVIAYLCKLKPKPGALNLEKCVEFGVQPGPLLGLLKNGIDVTLENGTVVKSNDVSEPSETGLSFIFLDLPTEHYFHSLEEQKHIFQNLNEAEKVSLIVHFSPANIVQHERYKNFMKNFNADTDHIYLNSDQSNFSGYISAHRIQYHLNQLHPHIFPLLAESNSQIRENDLKKLKLEVHKEMKTTLERNEHEKSKIEINSLTNFHLRPRKGFDHTMAAILDPEKYIKETELLENFISLKTELKSQLPLNNSIEYPIITFLGTGSCIPNKTRNVSAILVQPKTNAYMLLDCGEGTFGQLIRFFGHQKTAQVMRDLKAIYVSHLHADHHIGLIGLLSERKKYLPDYKKQKLLLFAPKQIEGWLNFYDKCIEPIQETYELIPNADILSAPLNLSDSYSNVGIEDITTCLVRHCAHSFGVSFTVNTKTTESAADKLVKITYSGDSMPCADLVELGLNSTILIHEATMEDDLVLEAKEKMHSTISQAIQVGRDMKSENIILTHFSQRYAKLPRLQNLAGKTEAQAMHNVSIAFDNMQVSLNNLKDFNLMYPALKALFAEHADELEQKALKRELKLERKRKLLSEE